MKTLVLGCFGVSIDEAFHTTSEAPVILDPPPQQCNRLRGGRLSAASITMRIYSYLFLMMGCVWGLATPANASPAINPGAMFSYLDSGKSALLKRIYNSGTSTAFVKVVVQEITFDADGKSVELPPQPLSNTPLADQNRLMASPGRMIIPASGMQSTRLLFMGPRVSERYYRVRFIPVLPSKDDPFDVSAEGQQAYKKELAAEVTILSGFGTVLFVRPDTVKYETQLQDREETYSVHNAGNSVVMLDFVKDCHIKNESDCSAIAQNYVLPGRTHTFKKLADRTYSFVLKEGLSERKVVVASN